MKAASKAENVDDDIRDFAPDVQQVLRALRRVIREVAPDAEESISYHIPTYKLGKKPLVYFAGSQRHVSLYPLTERSAAPLPRLAPYKWTRNPEFSLDKPVPLALVKQFIRLRLKEEKERANPPATRKLPSRSSRPRTG